MAAAVLATLLAPYGRPAAAQPSDEVRALWVVRTSLTSPRAVATMVESAEAAGFNTLLVQVRGRGDAYYSSRIEPKAAALEGHPGFDPLAEILARAKSAGLKVHAWVNVNLVADAIGVPTDPRHVVRRHPDWLMVPRQIAEDVAHLNPRSRQYVARLTRHVRREIDEIEGLYLSPAATGSADYTVDVIRDIVSRYPVDGVHLDYIRYPTADFDYSRGALEAFRASVYPDLGRADRQKYDARLRAEPLIYTQAFPNRWRTFRQTQLTRLVARIHTAVKTARPAAVVSAAVVPDSVEAVERKLQDWRGWVHQGLLDVVCPMAYTTDPSVFASQIADVGEAAGHSRVWAGIGAYRLSAAQIAHNVRHARSLGVAGTVLFSYDSLVRAPHGPGYLAELGRAAFIR